MKSRLKTRLVGHVVYGFFKLLHSTYRFRYHGEEFLAEARHLSSTGSIAIGIWHRNMLGCIFGSETQRLCILVSRSTDGEIISRVVRPFGIQTIRGSSTRGGREALDQLAELPPGSVDVGITVDGPLGPLFKAKAGIFVLAMKTGIAIVPMAAASRREWVLAKSWDRFRLPKPFATIHCAYGPPLVVPPSLSEEAMRDLKARFEQTLTQLDQELAARLGCEALRAAEAPVVSRNAVPG